ncbi:MAG: hypothetical protein WBA28_02245 [Microbacteriaceae bacterium]
MQNETKTPLVQNVYYGIGVAFIVLGGMVAAFAGPLQFEKGSWLAAYLVLILGVAQCILSRQSEFLGLTPPATNPTILRIAAWNLGNALVITGALSSQPIISDIGGVLLIIALVLALLDTRGSNHKIQAGILRAIYLILIVSIPIGLTLTHLRSI